VADSLESLAAALMAAAEDIDDVLYEEVKDAAKVIRDDWRAQWAGFKSAPYLSRAVTFDVFRLGGSVSAEIGPDKQRRQGALGNLLEFGSVNNAPRPAGGAALARGAAGVESRLADSAVELLEGDGG
jgi:hypothetical protein